MQVAQAPTVVEARRSLDRILSMCSESARKPSIMMPRVIAYPLCWFKLRRVANEFDLASQNLETVWKQVLSVEKSRVGFYKRDAGCTEAAKFLPSDDDFVAIEKDLVALERHFPNRISRIRSNAARCRKAANRLKIIFSVANEEMRSNADREYKQGTLLSLETLANGLQVNPRNRLWLRHPDRERIIRIEVTELPRDHWPELPKV